MERIDLGGAAIVAPGFLDLQTNGMEGLHFTHLGAAGAAEEERLVDEADVVPRLRRVARREVEGGVTGWWATVPTVEKGRWREVGHHYFPSFSFSFPSLFVAVVVMVVVEVGKERILVP